MLVNTQGSIIRYHGKVFSEEIDDTSRIVGLGEDFAYEWSDFERDALNVRAMKKF